MKKYIILLFALVFTISSCKKDKDADSDDPKDASELYIKFDLDGVAKEFKSNRASINTSFGAGAYTSSGFFDLGTDISIAIRMDQRYITGENLKALVGEKLKIPECVGAGCGTSADFSVFLDDSYDTFSTFSDNNPFPERYVKLNSVEFYKESVTPFGDTSNHYLVTGEFNVKIENGSDVRTASNGKFKLIFSDMTN